MTSRKNTSVLFVCLGNICRSPTAHGIFQSLVKRNGRSDDIAIDSCGTGDWHIGHSPDSRAQSTAKSYGYDLSNLRARQISERDFQDYDLILAMDKQNLADIESWEGRQLGTAKCGLFLEMAFSSYQGEEAGVLQQKGIAESYSYEVPDPYYGEDDGFKVIVELIEVASQLLLQQIDHSERAQH